MMFLESLPWPEVTSSDLSFILANGSCTTALGKAIKLRLWLGGIFSTIEAAIFDHNQYTLLLGCKTMSDLSVTTWFADNSWTLEHNNELIDLNVTFDSPTGPSFLCKPLAAQIKDNTWLNNVQQAQLQEVISAYSSHIVLDYNNLPEAPGFRHEIDTGNAKPVASWFYQLPQSKEELVCTEILKLLKQGMIRPSKSPWASPIVVVPKKGNKLHMCVNYISLNKVTISDHYPLPHISDILASFGGSQWFSNIDLFSRFHQILVEETNQPKTAFVTKWGQYEYVRMLFGLKGAPRTFQRIMNGVFKGLIGEFVTVYLDDITIYSKTFDKHLQHLKLCLDLIKSANLSVNAKKSILAV
ncbi:hypothetical protein DSO57_1039683 [Entomophthora muscae]|uniref:Uncharacterized protein n=1 Tax=Entomophthora muscae TaxID=34485 RepID=A0ACC2RM32_9FUNG|nr:hypothetical protein DSO57_1039683 [Entomophthora muscae]